MKELIENLLLAIIISGTALIVLKRGAIEVLPVIQTVNGIVKWLMS